MPKAVMMAIKQSSFHGTSHFPAVSALSSGSAQDLERKQQACVHEPSGASHRARDGAH